MSYFECEIRSSGDTSTSVITGASNTDESSLSVESVILEEGIIFDDESVTDSDGNGGTSGGICG
jgi:hypothetical protein